jgi:hypothetical protein
MMYFIHYENKGTSSSVSDLDSYIIRKLLDPVLDICTSNISAPIGNSDILTNDFPSIRLPTQGMTYHHSYSTLSMTRQHISVRTDAKFKY